MAADAAKHRRKAASALDGELLHWHVCLEANYQALYVQSRGALRRELAQYVKSQRSDDPSALPALTFSQHPPAAADQAVPGHWESDLIFGSKSDSAIATLVERSTRFVMLVHMPDGFDVAKVRQGLAETITNLPEALQEPLVALYGAKAVLPAPFSVAADCPVVFCDPAKPWLGGSNENTNGLLRQYFPKESDIAVHSAADLQAVAARLNGRPRKTLQWQTPAEALRDLLDGSAAAEG